MNNPDGNKFSWVKDFDQKLEDLLMEAEIQVLFATDNIKGFFSHAMEDLLPPVSDDPMTPEYYSTPTLCLERDNESGVLVEEVELFSTEKPAVDDETESTSDDNKETLDARVCERQLSGLDLDDESCVLVSDSEAIPAADIKGKQISYKQKIKDLLNLKRRFSIKNQIHQDTDSSNQQSSIKIVDSSSTKLNSNSIESEWEIV